MKKTILERAEQCARAAKMVPLRENFSTNGIQREKCPRAALVPFRYRMGRLQFFLMKPKAEKPDLDKPEFQIGKGTREPDEDILVTGLREALEEVGLRPEGIHTIFEWGGEHFKSQSTGKGKELWLYFAEVSESTLFDRPSTTVAKTAGRKWVDADRLSSGVRDDHAALLIGVTPVLSVVSRQHSLRPVTR